MTGFESLHRDSDHLVLPNKVFYPAAIPPGHWQLRNLISSPDGRHIYYASGPQIYVLDTVTTKRTHITTLRFAARCMASGFGYVCAGGGDVGHIAIIDLNNTGDSAQIDEVVPLEFGLRSSSHNRRDPIVRTEHLGNEIVNSVSIHKLEGIEDEGIRDDVVALFTNNDKTVRIYSLSQQLEVRVLDLAFAVNHATLSPDCKSMVAVGDYQSAYFFRRVREVPPHHSRRSNATYASSIYRWESIHTVTLHSPKRLERSYYFSTAWSPAGDLCAVASESGYITVFDMFRLQECEHGEDAILTVIESTRPEDHPGPGAVRAMRFAPQPWDLLVWTEDRGRACVADLRTGLHVKQVLHLDPNERNLRKIEAPDDGMRKYEVDGPLTEGDDAFDPDQLSLPSDPDFLRRLRHIQESDEWSAIEAAAHYLETSNLGGEPSDRRRRGQLREGRTSDMDLEGLTPHERQIMEALRSVRQRSSNRSPRSIQYGSNAGGSSSGGGNNSTETSEWRRSAPMSAFSDFPPLTRTSAESDESLFALYRNRRAWMRQGNGESGRSPLLLTPRRQASVIISNDDMDTSGPSASTSNGNSSGSSSLRHPPLPPHIRVSLNSMDRQRAAEELAHNRPSPPPAGDNHPDIHEIRRRRQLLRTRERTLSLREPRAIITTQEARMILEQSQGDVSAGVRTSGLVISPDGEKLWIGCESGIFEYTINLTERKSLPAYEMR